MNTIIINKILNHMIDFEHNKIHLSQEFAAINDTTRDYYHKKLEKTLNSNKLISITVGSLHELLLRMDKMLESDEEFMIQAKEITEQFYKLGVLIEAMPNCQMIYCECFHEGVHKIVIMKLNYQLVPTSVVEDGNVRITKRQVLPTQGKNVDEAIIIDVEDRTISLLEKKYLIDGKMNTYLNEQWIKGEKTLTDSQKYNTMKSVIKKIDDLYDDDGYTKMKFLLNEKMMNHEDIHPIDIVKKSFKDDEQMDEAETMMLENGISATDKIMHLPNNLAMCKIVTDKNVEISLPIEDYVNGNSIKQIKEDETYTILIENIEELYIK